MKFGFIENTVKQNVENTLILKKFQSSVFYIKNTKKKPLLVGKKRM